MPLFLGNKYAGNAGNVRPNSLFYSVTIKGGSGEPRKVFCGEYTNRNCDNAGIINTLTPLLCHNQGSEWRARARLHLRANTRSGMTTMLLSLADSVLTLIYTLADHPQHAT